ncbi:hypothetical protein JCM19045_506 [Bacillus sp. JCM 19045]|nr:hypothetical protein JCM19045_506 [Bacillus sp. JCM 19045]
MEKTPLEQAFLQQLQAQFLWTPEHVNHAKLDVLSYPYYFPVQTFNPHKALTRHEGHIISHLFNCLLSYDYEKQTFELELLHRYEKKENGRVWRFFCEKAFIFMMVHS